MNVPEFLPADHNNNADIISVCKYE